MDRQTLQSLTLIIPHCMHNPCLFRYTLRPRVLLTMVFAFFVLHIAAQEEEYNMEIGVLGGGCFYMGDANTSQLFLNTQPAAGILARYNLNPRMVLKGDIAYGRIMGSTDGQAYPGGQTTTFDRSIFELSTQFEYNFFAYGIGEGYKDNRRLTPYIQGGLGATYAPKPAEHILALHFPIGIGVKYKLFPRVNVGAEWTFRFTSSDKLDVTSPDGLQLSDPLNIKSGFMKNKDSYSFIMAYISYDIFAKECHCND